MNIIIDKEAEPVLSSTVITLQTAPPAAESSDAIMAEPEPENDPQIS